METNEPKLPKQQEDIEQLATKAFPSDKNEVHATFQQEGFIEGYKTASKKWSDEDMFKCWEAAKGFFRSNTQPLNFTEFLQSLTPSSHNK